MAADVKLFISHTTRDQRDFSLAHKLAEGLKTWGIQVWIAPESIPPGERWEENIVSAVLKQSSHFLVILSESSVRAPWVLREIALARERFEKGEALKVLPLRVGKLPEFEHADFIRQFQELPYSDQFSAQLRTLAATLSLPPALPALFRNLIKETTEHFVGRENVFSSIQQFLANERKGYFTLVADAGEGKTTILAEYVRRTGCPAHFNIAPAGVDTTEQFFESVKAQLGAHYDVWPTVGPGEAPSFSLQLADMLDKVAAARPKGEPFVLVVDALDEVKGASANSPVNVLHLPQVLPEGVFMLLSRRRRRVNFTTRERELSFDLKDFPGQSRRDVEHYLTRRLAEPAFEPWLSRKGWTTEQARAVLADRSENNFMYLHHVLRELAAGGFADPLEQLPEGLKGFYEYQWQRMGMNQRPAPELTLNVLYILALIHTPVSVRLLSQIVKAPTGDVRTVIENWREFLHVIREDEEERYRLYHASFQEFLRAKEDLQDIDPKRYRKLLTEHFRKRLFA